MKTGFRILLLLIGILLIELLLSSPAKSQPAEKRISRSQYIELYKDDAVREMLSSGVPASITLAQGILESGDGNSPLARYANNHFGIKCHAGWDGPSFIQDDDASNECFRKYYSVYDSYRDHSEFLRTRGRYDFLFDLKTTDYKGWAHGLKKAGYATNPKYPQLLIRIIEANNLQEYDKVVKMPKKEPNRKPEPVVATIEANERSIEVHENNIKFVLARKGDTPAKLAREFEMAKWQIYKYNDLGKRDKIQEGDIIYLQPKRKKSKKHKYHKTKKGETMRDISQMYGVKLKKLYLYNEMSIGSNPNKGDKIVLRKP